jgi:hypothetical protein
MVLEFLQNYFGIIIFALICGFIKTNKELEHIKLLKDINIVFKYFFKILEIAFITLLSYLMLGHFEALGHYTKMGIAGVLGYIGLDRTLQIIDKILYKLTNK